MSCIDKDILEIDADERAHSFAYHKMSEAEEEEFVEHLYKCNSCSDLVEEYIDLSRLAEISKQKDKPSRLKGVSVKVDESKIDVKNLIKRDRKIKQSIKLPIKKTINSVIIIKKEEKGKKKI